MTPEELAHIRKLFSSHPTIDALFAEIERLNAKVPVVTDEIHAEFMRVKAERDEARAERDDAREECDLHARYKASAWEERDQARVESHTLMAELRFAEAGLTDRSIMELKLREECARLRAALEEISEYGCRHDTNPTLDHEWSIAEWYNYIKSMDARVRDMAREALASQGGGQSS